MSSTFLDLAISLDGYIAGVDQQDPGLHDWYFAPVGAGPQVLAEFHAQIGAIVMGRRAYDDAADQGGFDDTPYKVPHFIITHRPQPPIHQRGATFTFVSSGIADALMAARAAAGERDVCIAGGAEIAQQFLEAGLLDELQLHVVPKLLGRGVRLFERPRSTTVLLKKTRVLESGGVTHLRFRVVNE
jgi:dihydrofolate reductase